MAQEEKVILDVEVRETGAVTLAELKDGIFNTTIELQKAQAAYKETDKGTEDYWKTLQAVEGITAKLKGQQQEYNRMMTMTAKETQAVSSSYYDLNNQLVKLRKQYKELSAAERDSAFGQKMLQDISALDDQLKEIDATMGQFQRNVGNYEGAIMSASAKMGVWGEGLEKAHSATTSLAGGVKNMGAAMKLVSTNPLLSIVMLITPLLTQIVGKLKENETAMAAIKKMMDALKPVFDLVGAAVEKVASWVAKAVDYFVELAGESGDGFKKIIAGAVGVGNALLQYMLTPIKTIISAFKGLGNIAKDILTGDFAKIKEDAAAAWEGVKDAFKNGFSFKANFAEGQRIGEQFAAGLGSKKSTDAMEQTGEALGESTLQGVINGLTKNIDAATKEIGGWIAKIAADSWAEAEAKIAAEEAKMMADLQALTEGNLAAMGIAVENAAEGVDPLQKKLDDLTVWYDAQKALLESYEIDTTELTQLYEKKKAKIIAENARTATQETRAEKDRQLAIYQTVSNSVSAIAGVVANAWAESIRKRAEAGKISEAQAQKEFAQVKRLQLAQTLINTAAGAVSAFAAPDTVAMSVKWANFAAVLASGAAQAITIANTSLGTSSTSDTSSSASASASSAAPYIAHLPEEVRTLTSASDEQSINKSQKVYIVESEIQAAGKKASVRQSESSF